MKYIISLIWSFIFAFIVIFIVSSILGSNGEFNSLLYFSILSVIFTLFVELLYDLVLDKKL